jgi:folate-binding protein YgfZ
LLNGQSRMIAQFDLLRISEQLFWLASPVECAQALADNLEKLHFAEELEIRKSSQTASAVQGRGERGKIFSWTDGETRRWPSGAAGFDFQVSSAPFHPDWEFSRIGAGLPWPVLDWDNNTPALEAGQLFAIDRDKGCYPGQEVVELSLNVGHPVRVMLSVEGDKPLVSGEKIALLPTGEGVVCSVASHGSIIRAFVRVPWNARESAPANFRKIRG